MPNALIHEKSPYLLQHAHNPVDWLPWGEAAFARARTESKPIFLSVGYSTCHWCHVMEHESFENPDIAALLNAEFISIKVDREERPDVDQIYMAFVQATTGHGGWPMSVWLTPDLHPFAGGTYFPPQDRYGRPGFATVLRRIAGLWRGDRERLARQGREVVEALRRPDTAPPEPATALRVQEAASRALAHFRRAYDPEEGGFGGAPKFPRPAVLDFLFRQAFALGFHHEDGRAACEMALHTLRRMASGGMADPVGGGFHRYSVDARWHVPHFEKMLYDQAQLACSCLEAYQISGDGFFAGVARDIFGYVQRDLSAPGGGFYSAEDADSLPEAGAPRKTEGAFYTWRRDELERVLGPEDAAWFCRTFDCRAEGNVEAASDPQGELAGVNVLFGSALDDPRWPSVRDRLRSARDRRPRPHLDDKILTAWNGLMISALARGAAVLDQPALAARAAEAAAFLRRELWQPESGTLLRSHRDGPSGISGFLADYAFLIRGLLDLYEAGGDSGWLDWALELQAAQERHFSGSGSGAYFNTRTGADGLILRMKDDDDGAEPSGNAVSTLNLLRLAAMTRRGEWMDKARGILDEYAAALATQGTALPLMLAAALAAEAPPAQAVLAGGIHSPEGRSLLTALHRKFHPFRVVLHAPASSGALRDIPELRAMAPVDGKPAVYLCENFTCQAPITDPRVLAP